MSSLQVSVQLFLKSTLEQIYLTVEGTIADETEYTLECRQWPYTSWDVDPLADSARWNTSLCDTTINDNIATRACQGTGFVAIFQGKELDYTSTFMIVVRRPHSFTGINPTWDKLAAINVKGRVRSAD